MIVYMSYGAYFYDFNINKTIGFVSNQHYNPFKCSIKKISDHELLIGSENTIDLIDYKNFKKIRTFENDTTYAFIIYQINIFWQVMGKDISKLIKCQGIVMDNWN